MMTLIPTSMRTLAFAAAAALLLAAPTAHAQTTIGAPLTTSVGPLTRGTSGFQSFGQSFTVPSLTTRLSSVSLSFSNFFNGGALRFDAYLYAFDAASRRVTGNALWNFLNIAGSSNDFAFDTRTFATGNLSLSAGATYLFLVTTSNQGGAVPMDAANLIGASESDAYAGGSFWIASNGADTGALATTGAFSAVDGIADADFSAVFAASQQIVPEPATLVLTGAGLFGVAFLARRRRAA